MNEENAMSDLTPVTGLRVAMPDDAALKALFAAMGPGNAMIVGGAVRALILGEDIGDIDIATKLTPPEVVRVLEGAGFKVVPTGIDHGTVTAVMNGRALEVTTLRRDVATDGRRAVIAFTTSWVEDAERRDFSMNTLLCDVDGNIHDPLGNGVADLQQGVVRFVGDAATRIQEDALRILRFFRFHARYGKGEPDCNGREACVHNRHLIENLSRERVTMEMEKMLPAPYSAISIASMIGGGILPALWQGGFDARAYDVLRKVVSGAGFSHPAIVLLTYCVYSDDVDVLDESLKKYFVFSNKKRKFLFSCLKAMQEEHGSVEEYLYHFGSDVTLAAALLNGVINIEDVSVEMLQASVTELRGMAIPVFPLGAKHLMAEGVPQGKMLGDILKKVEAWWLSEKTAPGLDACIAHARGLMAATQAPQKS